MIDDQWYVLYDIPMMDLSMKVGPWPLVEAIRQRDDIQGYEGVQNVRLQQKTRS